MNRFFFTAGVDASNVGPIEGREDPGGFGEPRGVFEHRLVGSASLPCPGETGLDGELEHQGQIGPGKLRLAVAEDATPVEPDGSLIRDSREEVAVGQHPASRRHGRRDHFANVFASVLEEPAKLLLGRDALPGPGHGTDPATLGAVGGLASLDHVFAAIAQNTSDAAKLGGLPGAVHPFGRRSVDRASRPERLPRFTPAVVPSTAEAANRRGIHHFGEREHRSRAWHGACSLESRAFGHARQHPSNGTGGRRVSGTPGGGMVGHGEFKRGETRD